MKVFFDEKILMKLTTFILILMNPDLALFYCSVQPGCCSELACIRCLGALPPISHRRHHGESVNAACCSCSLSVELILMPLASKAFVHFRLVHCTPAVLDGG